MYGVLLSSVIDYIKKTSDASILSKLSNIMETNVANDKLNTVKCLDCFSKHLKGLEFYDKIGSHLVNFLSESSCEVVFFTHWSAYKEFLTGLEKFNEYLQVYFLSKETPVFTITKITGKELDLECWSDDKRTIYFTIGLIRQVGLSIYKEDVRVLLVDMQSEHQSIKALIKIQFKDAYSSTDILKPDQYAFPLQPKLLGEIFPYSIVIRDLMLAEAQQTVELKMAFDQEKEKQAKLECFLRKLNEEMERTNAILNEMIPEKSYLRFKNEPGMQQIEDVTVLISDIVKFTAVCSLMKPMEVVTTLNAMYSKFDYLTAKHGACKVETIGDAYMIVSPVNEKESAQKVCDVALDMREAIKNIRDPKTGDHLQIRIGIHTGAVVAGIVGLKVPKFCVFGSTVKVAILLEASSSPMKIKISKVTKESLTYQYKITESEPVNVNTKGIMRTFWLVSKDPKATQS